jgi:predicted glycogen debranching enzyme
MTADTTHHLEHRSETDPTPLLEHEWLLTNGVGGFAMGTALGANTRRYHGLLIAAARPPVDRVVVLHQVFEELVLTAGDGTTQALSLGPMLFRDERGKRVTAPDCADLLRRFDHGLDAVWSYAWGGLALTRRLVLHDGEPACTLHYDLHGLNGVCERAELRLRPMLTLRGFHDLSHRADVQHAIEARADGDTLYAARGDRSAVYRTAGAECVSDPQWWERVDYPIERHRGLGDREDYAAPAVFRLPLPATDDAAVRFTAALGGSPASPQDGPERRRQRLRPIIDALTEQTQDENQDDADRHGALPRILARAADDFIVRRDVAGRTLSTIIAGYPWFADWGRDTFIALPGLLLCTGRADEARDTLAAFAGALRGGLVPNRFDDDDPTLAHYNTVDASMWFVHSALAYLDHTNDRDAWDGWLADACLQIVEGYRTGTHADPHAGGEPVPIAMQPDGLIAAGHAHSQLTWMDAAAPDAGGRPHVFTPRPGKCVEINALWYSALVQLAQRLPVSYKTERKRYAELAARTAASFSEAFWSDDLGHLVDHLAPDGEGEWAADTALRPNQMIACALEYSPVRPEHRARSVAAVRAELLTPVGLRTLPADDPDYHRAYGGPPFERDGAYHRGTVWPWLIGPYAEAVLRAGGFSAAARQEARDAIAPLLERLATTRHPGMLGQLHEIHEPEPPFAPRGCPAQAWSVAEVLRIRRLLQRPTG